MSIIIYEDKKKTIEMAHGTQTGIKPKKPQNNKWTTDLWSMAAGTTIAVVASALFSAVVLLTEPSNRPASPLKIGWASLRPSQC